MTFEVEIGGRRRKVEITEAPSSSHFLLDGATVNADVEEIAEGIYSVLLNGASFEVSVEREGRGLRVRAAGKEWKADVLDSRHLHHGRDSVAEAEGRQHVTAPMPGKVVRVLVKLGDEVEVGRGLVVVEAMKMQNEIRSPKTGTVERLLVSEGQAVNAGDTLAVVA